MKSEVHKILSLTNFFKIINKNANHICYSYKKPSILLAQNIYLQWLQSYLLKADKQYPIVLNKPMKDINIKSLPFGIIKSRVTDLNEEKIIEQNLNSYLPMQESLLEFKLIVSEQNIMQYFIQWQRYRKYWWSSVTTTPSLFCLDDIKYGEGTANVDIKVQFPWGSQVVEKVSINSVDPKVPSTASLECSTTLEAALLTLLSDGVFNSTKEEYLRLERRVAPFKISFALDCDDTETKSTLHDLALLLYGRLSAQRIRSRLPEFTLPLDEQLKENRQLGVVYTAILSEQTLVDGIFHLMNSSTMLKEQIHVADFDSYAALLCGQQKAT